MNAHSMSCNGMCVNLCKWNSILSCIINLATEDIPIFSPHIGYECKTDDYVPVRKTLHLLTHSSLVNIQQWQTFKGDPVYATKIDVTQQQWQIFKFSERPWVPCLNWEQ